MKRILTLAALALLATAAAAQRSPIFSYPTLRTLRSVEVESTAFPDIVQTFPCPDLCLEVRTCSIMIRTDGYPGGVRWARFHPDTMEEYCFPASSGAYCLELTGWVEHYPAEKGGNVIDVNEASFTPCQ